MRSLRVFARRIKGGAAAPLDTAKTDLWKGRKEGGQNRSLNVQFTIDGINIDKPRLAEKNETLPSSQDPTYAGRGIFSPVINLYSPPSDTLWILVWDTKGGEGGGALFGNS